MQIFIKHLLCARCWEMQHWIDRHSPYSHILNSILAKTLNKSLGTGFLMVQPTMLSVDSGKILTSTIPDTELKTADTTPQPSHRCLRSVTSILSPHFALLLLPPGPSSVRLINFMFFFCNTEDWILSSA